MSPPCYAVCTVCSQSPCRILISIYYSELTKTSTALARLAVTCVLSAARRLVLIFVNSLYKAPCPKPAYLPASPYPRKGAASTIAVIGFQVAYSAPQLVCKKPHSL